MIETLVEVTAEICAGPSCDFNGDGSLDVRDLVTMVHCILGSGPCPDTSRTRLDCNRDGRLGVDDVLCCAGTILRGGGRDSVAGRPEPDVGLFLDPPRAVAGGLELMATLSGSSRVGAARFAFDFPSACYDVDGVTLDPNTGGWLELHEVVDGRLVVGLIGLGGVRTPQDGPGSDPVLLLRLTRKPGQPAGGTFGLADAQFAGPDGATLDVPYRPAPVPLPATGVTLSAAQPNPFARETRVTLSLDAAAETEVAIHDLGGRRIATLFHGRLEAGPHEFAWTGVRSDGSLAANGVYFVRAHLGGRPLVRKVIYLRGD